MITRARALTLPHGFFAAFVACGGAQNAEPEPETPARAEEAPAAAAPAKPSDETSEGPAEAKDESEKRDDSEKEPAKPSRSPKRHSDFRGICLFSFADSDPGANAESQCSTKNPDDPKKKARCVAKARNKIDHDAMIFKQEADGTWTWTQVRRVGARVTVAHKVQFEFGEEKGNTITLKIKGKDKGLKPRPFPAEVVIETTDDGISMAYTLLGLMVYVGKLGQVDDVGR